jgi:hypothetical protein
VGPRVSVEHLERRNVLLPAGIRASDRLSPSLAAVPTHCKLSAWRKINFSCSNNLLSCFNTMTSLTTWNVILSLYCLTGKRIGLFFDVTATVLSSWLSSVPSGECRGSAWKWTTITHYSSSINIRKQIHVTAISSFVFVTLFHVFLLTKLDHRHLSFSDSFCF